MSTATLNLGSPGGVSRDALEHVRALLAVAIHGLPYLFARSSYGGELTLHFGAQRGYSHPKLQGETRGTYVLSVRGSAWLLTSGVQPIMVGCGIQPPTEVEGTARPFNVTALESGALIGPGARISQALPLAAEPLNAIGLRLVLDDGSAFMIFPTPADQEAPGLPEPADWELLTPTMLLRVGPGPTFEVEDPR